MRGPGYREEPGCREGPDDSEGPVAVDRWANRSAARRPRLSRGSEPVAAASPKGKDFANTAASGSVVG